MKKMLVVAVLVAAICSAVPAFAGDVVAMPTGNMMPKGGFELNYIYWDFDNPAGAPEYAHIGEAFYGVTDWLELDVIAVDVDKDDTYVEANAYVRLVKETPRRPVFIVGATNITGSDFLMNSDDVSPFALMAYNINMPQGKPSLNDPLVRLHLAWGDKFHGDRWFGGFQMLFSPKFGGAVFNYQGQPSYVGIYRLNKAFELRAGTKNGTAFYSAGWDTSF